MKVQGSEVQRFKVGWPWNFEPLKPLNLKEQLKQRWGCLLSILPFK
jgi:hypothetical protein